MQLKGQTYHETTDEETEDSYMADKESTNDDQNTMSQSIQVPETRGAKRNNQNSWQEIRNDWR